METLRPVKFTLILGKYLYYIGIEFSDKSSACFTEQPEDSSTPIQASEGGGTFGLRSPSPGIDKRSSTESVGLVQSGATSTAEKAQTYEITLEDGEYVVEVWGRLFSRGTYVSSIGLYTNKERAFGPFGNAIGKPFNFTAPSPSHFLLKIVADGTKYNGYPALKWLTPAWDVVSPKEAPLVYRPRMLAAVLKKLSELKIIVESLSVYISRMVNHIPPDDDILFVLGLSSPSSSMDSMSDLSSSGSSKKKIGVFKKTTSGSSSSDLMPLKDNWAITCFRIADDVLSSVEETRKNYPTTLNTNIVALRLLTDIEAYAQSLKDISFGYIEDDDIPFPTYASTAGHSNDFGSKVAFYIISEADKNLVLAVDKGLLNPGAKIVATPFRRGDDSQLFIFTPKGMIRSLKSGLVLSVPLSAENNLVSGVQVTQEEEEEDPVRVFRQVFKYYAQSKSIRVEADMEANPSFCELDVPCLCLQLVDGSQNDEEINGNKEEEFEEDANPNGTKAVIVSTPLRDRSQKWCFKR